MALRFQAHEFRARTEYGAIASCDLIDWPFGLEELRPYYERAERRMGVSGVNGLPDHPTNNHFRILCHGANAVAVSRGQ